MHAVAISDLLELDDIPFLKAIVKRYPETRMLAGKSESTPNGNQLLADDALAYKVFEADTVDPSAIEADRTFLGLLLLFKAALAGDKSKFPHLNDKNFNTLRDFTLRIANTESAIEFVLYSLACNDLGKTYHLIDEAIKITGRKAPDHDQLLTEVVEQAPLLFPGLQGMSEEQRTLYSEGLNANLNLGQFVQGENLPFNLVGMQNISEQGRNLRLLAELYDFAGVTGHINPDISLVMTNENFFAFHTAIEELMKEPKEQSYLRYIASRAAKIGIIESSNPQHFVGNPEAFALGRIVCLARVFKPEEGAAIQRVWKALPRATRDLLTQELNETGFGARPGVLIYYAPDVIGNAVKGAGDFERGLKLALLAMADVYREARAKPSQEENIITFNVNGLAKGMAEDIKNLHGESISRFIHEYIRSGVIAVEKAQKSGWRKALDQLAAPSSEMVDETYHFTITAAQFSGPEKIELLTALKGLLQSRMIEGELDEKTATLVVKTGVPSTHRYIEDMISAQPKSQAKG